MLESERKLIIVAHGPAGGVELLLLLRGEMQLDDVRDAVATHDRRDARIDIVLTVLTVQQDRDRKDAVLVVENGADDLRRRRADAELGAALAAQDGPAALAARIGEDYADYINSLTDPEAAPEQAAPEPETAKPAGVQAWSARELSEMVLPPIRHVVEGLLPMGMGVLVAKPKLGKSWMVLDLCLAVAQGEPFLGFPTRQHGTLYLALEDGKSRMQTRLRRLLEGRPAPANMHVMFQAQRLGEGLLEMLGEYLDANPDIHLVCIDTLSKIKPKAKPFENAYDADYDYMGRLKAFADSRGICVLLVHHTRKSKNPEDSFDNINGSTGILGAADFTIVLDKQSRMDDEAGFLLTGRDIEQCERVIRFDKARCRWVMQGTAAQLAAQRRVAEYEAEPIVKTLRVLLQQGDGTWSGYSKNLMEMGQRYAHTELAPNLQMLSKRIQELQPMLWERDTIRYWYNSNGNAGRKHNFRQERTDHNASVPVSAQLSLRHNYH